MKTALCSMLGIDLPLVAFSHCRDVVAAVSRAGGLGVLGASSIRPHDLDAELDWIDAQVGGRPYGVDVVIPQRYAGKGEHATPSALEAMIPEAHRHFVDEILTAHDIDPSTVDHGGTGVASETINEEGAEQLLDIAFGHSIGLIANALGIAPPMMIDRAARANVPVAALVGSVNHAVRQVQAGVDILVAQGTEAGGHCGETSTLVLVPEVIEAIEPVRSVPVLAAGGIVTGRQMAAAIALGAAGVWTGSVWLTTAEAETAPYTKEKMLLATSADTVRSKARTGKPARQLRSDWTDAWEAPGSPAPLPMPLQPLLTQPAMARIDTLAASGHPGAQALSNYFVGQGIGLVHRTQPVRAVILDMMDDFVAAAERLRVALED
jgi:NAD(P)H-dependent flavin oxidoreductase YrpB (nitropropane dioxygenase family)